MKKFFLKKSEEQGADELNTLCSIWQSLKEGEYQIEIKRKRKPRSNEQNAWLWGCIYPLLLDGLIDLGWEFTDVEQVHEFFKVQMTNDRVINKDTGEIVEFPSSTAKMDTIAFSTYTDRLRQYAKEYLNIDIPDPQ